MGRILRRGIAAMLLVPCLAGATELLEGTVTTSTGLPVAGAWVGLAESGLETHTDSRGHFRFPKSLFPSTLTVVHPRFLARTLLLDRLPKEPLVMTLTAKQQMFEEIVVSAERANSSFSPPSGATSSVRPAEQAVEPSTLTEALQSVPGVAENGQGGLFQTYSIRGVSRQRVLTMVGGVQLVGERRAGVSGSFIDPQLMGDIEVLRGPSSTHFGSGALGGVVQIFPSQFTGWTASAGYDSNGHEANATLGWGDRVWSGGFATRRASNARAPDSSELNSGFTQLSGFLNRKFALGSGQADLLIVGSLGKDIGKSNTDFPKKTTIYPRERHLIVRFEAEFPVGLRFKIFSHPNDLVTEKVSDKSLNRVENQAFDSGATLEQELEIGQFLNLQVGVDWFSRRGVTARETGSEVPPGLEELRTLDGASRDDIALFATSRWSLGGVQLLAGGRLTYQTQGNAGWSRRADTAWSGFAGAVLPVGKSIELAANVGTGLRFPSLSERFFSGSTGRGGVVGNPDLVPEQSLDFDFGIRWFGKSFFLGLSAFDKQVEHYIERIEIDPDLLTYVNLTSGTIRGLELEGAWQPARGWNLFWVGHLMRGRSDDSKPLADLPAHRLLLGASRGAARWKADTSLQMRASRQEPASGEKPIPAAYLWNVAARLQMSGDLWLTLSGDNLLNQSYYSSADRKAPLAPERSVAVGFRWTAR